MQGNLKILVDTEKAAVVLGVSKSKLNKDRMTGDGPPYVKIGAAVRYDLDALEAYKTAHTRHSTSERQREVA